MEGSSCVEGPSVEESPSVREVESCPSEEGPCTGEEDSSMIEEMSEVPCSRDASCVDREESCMVKDSLNDEESYIVDNS